MNGQKYLIKMSLSRFRLFLIKMIKYKFIYKNSEPDLNIFLSCEFQENFNIGFKPITFYSTHYANEWLKLSNYNFNYWKLINK